MHGIDFACKVLGDADLETQKHIRKSVLGAILGTDMVKHAEHLRQITAQFWTKDGRNLGNIWPFETGVSPIAIIYTDLSTGAFDDL